MKKPYLKKIRSDDSGVEVWEVDGPYIRKNMDIEFTNEGHHWTFRFIPESEIWIDKEANPNEKEFFILHQVEERKLMKEGKSYEKALKKADVIEKDARKTAGKVGLIKSKTKSKFRKKLLDSRDNVNIWLVNGKAVRDQLDIDFVEGGHNYVYKFIPKNEIWIDDDVVEKERQAIITHELVERELMIHKIAYKKAHEIANKIELQQRKSK